MARTVQVPTGEEASRNEVGKQPTELKLQPTVISSPRDVQRTFDNLISQAAGIDMQTIQTMMSSRFVLEIKEREKDDEKEDVLEKRERIAESEEKEKKEFREEQQEKEEVQQQLAEEIEKRMPVVMLQRYI